MAAKPPKPPAILLKPNSCRNDKKTNKPTSNNNKTEDNVKDNKSYESQDQGENSVTNLNNNKINTSNNNKVYNDNQSDLVNGSKSDDKNKDIVVNKDFDDRTYLENRKESQDSQEEGCLPKAEELKPSCSCTNISIMHLFHEMKQKFPTIPDHIVTQVVNENCHLRDNCIQMLNNELALNPIPNQAYPSKILQKQKSNSSPVTVISATNSNSNSNISSLGLKPLRPAPATPTPSPMAVGKLPSKEDQQQQNQHHHLSSNSSVKNYINSLNNLLESRSLSKSVDFLNSSESLAGGSGSGGEVSDMPAVSSPQILSNATVAFKNNGSNSTATIENYNYGNNNLINNSNNHNNNNLIDDKINLPRVRPTTLNIQTHEQQQSQNLLAALQQQLQNKFQQQKQEQQGPPIQKPLRLPQKPLRRAPLPPLPAKPASLTQQQQNKQNYPLIHSQQNSFSTDSSSCVTSPLSPNESEISVNVSLSSPTSSSSLSLLSSPTAPPSASSASPTLAQPQRQQQPTLPPRPPIRHCSIITVQPEPPYTKDFLISPPTTSTSTSTSGKSFTSVNLTLRQPNPNVNSPVSSGGVIGGLNQSNSSTIDITAGPANRGLTYSSSSYDPRLGYKKNFQITVTDEGSVVSASSLRPSRFNVTNENDKKFYNSQPPPPPYQEFENPQQQQEQNPVNNSFTYDDYVFKSAKINLQNIDNENNSPSSISSSNLTQQQQQQQHQQNHQEEITVAMCYKRDAIGFNEKIEKQKQRRDVLANELRRNKVKKNQLEREINTLTEPINDAVMERLYSEIESLRRDCTALSTGPVTAPEPAPEPRLMPAQHFHGPSASTQSLGPSSSSYFQHQQQPHPPQPFPRSRPSRSLPRLSSNSNMNSNEYLGPSGAAGTLDFVQHHGSTTNSPLQQSPNNINNRSNCLTPQQQQEFLLEQFQERKRQQDLLREQQLSQQESLSPTSGATPSTYLSSDINDYYTDSQSEGDEYDDDDETQNKWTCNLCTFLNHPQLNVCETCENIRLLPGTFRIRQSSSANSMPNPASSLASLTNPNLNSNDVVDGSNGPLPSSNSNLEHDAQLTQQQFALPT